MATIYFGAGFTGGFQAVLNSIIVATTEAYFTSFTTTQVVLHDGPRTFTLDGSNFQVDLIGGRVVLTSGTIDSMTVRQGIEQIIVTDLDMSVAALSAAIQAEGAGQIDAIENFVTARDWVYHGTNAADILLEGSTSSDGAVIRLTGNDTFTLGGGDDDVFMGDGRDTAYGQTGNDTLSGGRGIDRLEGGNGNDTLNGGIGRDKLFGGNGRDIVRGGGGDDILTGGAGRDKLIGGGGSDRFVFRAGDGADVIRNYQDGIDVLRFVGMADPTDITDTGRGALITYDGDSVLLIGIAAADITTDDFF